MEGRYGMSIQRKGRTTYDFNEINKLIIKYRKKTKEWPKKDKETTTKETVVFNITSNESNEAGYLEGSTKKLNLRKDGNRISTKLLVSIIFLLFLGQQQTSISIDLLVTSTKTRFSSVT